MQPTELSSLSAMTYHNSDLQWEANRPRLVRARHIGLDQLKFKTSNI